jgi:phage major head subunit gpT-like protein
VAFFSGSHPLNPFDASVGTYTNNFTAGSGPGAVPIDTSVTVDVALANLGKAIQYVHTLKMPNGVDPRGLRVSKLVVPSALVPRAQQLTNAKYIAQAAASGGGAADIEAMVANWGLGAPEEAPELSAAFGGSDVDYYLLAESITSDDVGAFTYVNREPFQIVYNGEMTDAQLARVNELQWLTRGRNVVGLGHPYLAFRCRAT